MNELSVVRSGWAKMGGGEGISLLNTGAGHEIRIKSLDGKGCVSYRVYGGMLR